jgi:hypothetical protein
MARQPVVGPEILIVEASRRHSDTPHSVGLLWAGDQVGNRHCCTFKLLVGIKHRNLSVVPADWQCLSLIFIDG